MNSHLEWIEIENFKCFEKLRVEGLERVNLIGGENNVGKTAFMEACYINVHSKDKHYLLNSLINTLFNRDSHNLIINKGDKLQANIDFEKAIKYINDFKIISNLRNIVYILDNKKFYFILNGNKEIMQNNLIPKNIDNIIFIGTNIFNNIILKGIYNKLKVEKQKQVINSLINEFDERINHFKFISEKPKIYINNKKIYQDLSSFGDGLKRFITIICAIWASKDGVLFIDEIENGIHYTKLPKLWEIIFKTSKEANCQVFATTHSLETIKYFNKMQFELNEENTAYFEFMRSVKSGKIGVSKRDKERLEYSLTHGGRFRGE